MAENVLLKEVSDSGAQPRDFKRNVYENCQESSDSHIDQALQDSDVDQKVGNPWNMFGEYEKDAKEDIFRFLRFEKKTTKTLCNGCKADDPDCIVPAKRDSFGIVSSVKCILCETKTSLRINTVNRNKLTAIEFDKNLKIGDEIM